MINQYWLKSKIGFFVDIKDLAVRLILFRLFFGGL